ncbi:DUF2207 domain-containing protein [Clostridium sp. YIM B02515]|uniref:DUF2207 domain-containing protein n=1 Tax=Clostridium rhizosphaerae TaxID=2803861 RepID=A0ABS1TB41_9CLOT|nr:DUF2207 domain-containing protein [Clostridium rhizosphaerae]MBL4936569.1 DUF2207 domain-containing protein [Clostridium rhizosphaerae]
MRLNKWIIGIFISLAFTVSLGSKVQAEEIKLKSDVIKTEITQDGSMNTVEDLSFDISGKYNGVYKDISFDKGEGISNITVSELKGSEAAYKEVKSASNGDKGVYSIEKKSNSVRLKIYSPSKDEIKNFRISYKIPAAVKKYNDIGELYWKFIGSDNETKIENLQISLILPKGARKEEMKVFGHGPLDGAWRIQDDRTINFSVLNVPSGRYVEVRTLFPRELVPQAKISSNENKFESIMAEENRYINEKIEKAKEREKIIEDTKIIAILMSVVSLLIIICIFIRRKKYYYVDDLIAGKDIANYNPAILAYNAKAKLMPNDLMAAVMELSRRGYLSIEGKTEEYKIKRIRKKDDNTFKHEAYLMHLLIDEIGDGNSVTIEAIKNYGKDKPNDLRRQFALWRGEVKLEADKLNLHDKKADNIKSFIIIFEIILIAAAVFLVALGNLYGFISIIASSLAFSAVFLINTRTLEGEVQLALWNKMKRRIKNLNKFEIEELQNKPLQGEIYLIYAVSMGLRSDLIYKITPKDENYVDETGSSFWAMYYMMSSDNDSFYNSFETPIKNTEYGGSFSSSDSSGGFDSGGGGGAGGF